MTVVVLLSAALICLKGECYPALVGRNTLPGQYKLTHERVLDPLYGGDVLAYRETATEIYAVHRVWLGRPGEHRAERLASGGSSARHNVTGGCINVTPKTYDLLVAASVTDL